MSAKNDKKKAQECVTMFTPLVRKANKPHKCDGCGECPINEGDLYMLSTSRGPDGKFRKSRYCIRCCLAIEVKKAFSPDGNVAVMPGDLKLSKLSAKFRNTWIEMVEGIKQAQKEHDEDGARRWSIWFQDQMGISGIGATKERAERVTKLILASRERRETARQEVKRLKDVIDVIVNCAMNLASEIQTHRDEVAKARLAYNIATQRGKDEDAIAADERLVSALNSLQTDVEVLRGFVKAHKGGR